MKKYKILALLLLIIVTVSGCSSTAKKESPMIRQFIAKESATPEEYMIIKQDGYGVISEWRCYNMSDELTAYIECEFEDIFMKEQRVYDANGNLDRRIVYEREPNGKLINRKMYRDDELIFTEFFQEETENMPAISKDNTIVRYDELGRVIRMKSISEDGSEELIITEYDNFGLKREITYIDGEESYRLELSLQD